MKILVFLALLLLQSTVRFLPTPELRVDLILLMVFYCGFSFSLARGGLAVLAMGLTAEIFSVPSYGLLTLSYLSVFFFLRVAEGRLLIEGNRARAVWVLLLTLMQKGVEAALLGGRGKIPPPLFLFASAVLEGAAALIFFPLMERLTARLRKET